MMSAYAIDGVIPLIFTILSVVGMWRLFEIFGESGWKALIPIYSEYMLFKIFWDTSQFWKMVVFCVLIFFSYLCMTYHLAMMLFLDAVPTLFWVGLLLTIVFIVWNAVLTYNLCKNISESCGKGLGTTLGLFFFRPIFLIWLGFTVDPEPHFETFHQVDKD